VQHMDPQEQQRQELLHQEFLRQQQLLGQQAAASQVAGQQQMAGLQEAAASQIDGQQQTAGLQEAAASQVVGQQQTEGLQQAAVTQVAGQHQGAGLQEAAVSQVPGQQQTAGLQEAAASQVVGQQQTEGLQQAAVTQVAGQHQGAGLQEAAVSQVPGQQQTAGLQEAAASQVAGQQQASGQQQLLGQQQGHAMGQQGQAAAQGASTVTNANVQEMLQHSIEQEQQMQAQLQQAQGLGTGEQQSGVQQQQQQQQQFNQQQQKQQNQQQQDQQASGTSLGSTDLEDRMIGRRRRLMQTLDEEDGVETAGEQQQSPLTQEQRQQQQQEETVQVQQQQLRLQEQHLSAIGQSQGRLRLDQLTVDIDMNTFWVLREILQAGYRPRSLTVEFNRNLGPDLSFAAVYMPKENWQIDDVSEDNAEKSMRATCYFGASAVALNRLAGYYGYVPVAVDEKGVNIFYVHNSTVGGVPVFTWEEVVANVDAGIQAKAKEQGDSSTGGAGSYDSWSDPSIWNPLLLNTTWSALHGNCHDSVWLEVNKDVDFGRGDRLWGHGHPNHFARQMRPVLLRHEPIDGTTRRRFYQPRGVPRFGWVDAPEGVQEEQYWAPEHPDQPSVQLRLQLKAQQEAQAMASAGSQWQTDAPGWGGNSGNDRGDGFGDEGDEEEEEEEDLDQYGDEATVNAAAEYPPPSRQRRTRRKARGAQSRYSSNSFDDGDYSADYFGDSSFDDEGEGYGTFGGGRGRRRGRRGGRRRRGFSPVANMRGVLSSLHLAAAFLFGIMASLLVSMLARRNRTPKVGALPTYRVKS